MKIRPSMVIIQKNTILLLQYNYNGHIVFGLPGGNPEDGETITGTLVRELAEELSVKVKVGPLLFVGEVILTEGKATLHCVFEGGIISGNPAPNSRETTALNCVWLPIDEIDSVNMYPNIGRYIKHMCLSKRDNANVYLGRINQKWF